MREMTIPIEMVCPGIIGGLGEPPKNVWMLQSMIYGTPKYYGVQASSYVMLAGFISEELAFEYLRRHKNSEQFKMVPTEFPWEDARGIAVARPVDGILVAMSEKVASPFFTR